MDCIHQCVFCVVRVQSTSENRLSPSISDVFFCVKSKNWWTSENGWYPLMCALCCTYAVQELVEEERKGMRTHEDRVEGVYKQKQEQVEQMGHLVRFYALPQIFVDTNESYNEMKRQHDEVTFQRVSGFRV